ncbi:MAG: glutamine-hydrolyzing GMP synthase [Firmicutes bacterium]|nr:glutamine-hydrolyzing GMP synthase [Bacillota bacterium]
MKHQSILVVDFGGQYNQLIARRVRDLHVYAEVVPYNRALEKIEKERPEGIIFTGGPNSVFDPASPHADPALFEQGIPVLGICYGAQLLAYQLGGRVETAPVSEYGRTDLYKKADSAVMKDVSQESVVWMSHTDYIAEPPAGFEITAYTDNCPAAAIEAPEKGFYAVQFHPEVTHSVEGQKILSNFVFGICGCDGDWKMDSFVESAIESIRKQVGTGRALCALSGGVDSSVAAVLMSRAIGSQLTCVFVDQGLLRKDEGDEVEAVFGPEGAYELNFIRVNVQERFYEKLKGVTEPEEKRKIIGEEFIRVFEEESRKLGKVNYLVQGTIYPDVIESGAGDASVIKSHHNVGGLPDVVDFDAIVEPLRDLFKDEVRAAGIELGIPYDLVWRQPFPGPGLAIRVMGEITEEKLSILREADAIFRQEITSAKLEKETNQYFAVLTNGRSVGVMGDARTYGYTLALRAVSTDDFMTADWTRLPYELLAKASSRITNEVRGISRVVYDITSKPPATVEWE